MRAQLLHLSGPLRGRTKTHDAANVLIGTAPDAHTPFPEGSPGVQPRHAEIAFKEKDCCFYLRSLDGKVFVGRKEVTEVILEHGDLLEIGAGGPKLRFHIDVEKGAACKPVRRMLEDATDVGKESGPFAFSQSFIRDLFTHATLTLKIGFPLAVLAIILLVSYFGGWLGQRRSSRGDSAKYEQMLADLRADQEANQRKLEQALSASKAEVGKLRSELAARNKVVDRLVRSNQALQQVLGEYSRGVCLVHGIWGLQRTRGGSTEPMRNRSGRPVRFEYVGSGFLVSKDGQIVTNRHVAQPWWRDAHATTAMSLGYEPKFERLTVTFPGRMPVDVDPQTVRVSADDRLDAAVLKLPVTKVPILPLYRDKSYARLRGDKVILLGYPTGMSALLAKADPDVLDRVRRTAKNLTQLIHGLAAAGQVSPTASQGSVNEIGKTQMVYDAATMSGGSGGPLFNSQGRVIAVNAARLSDYSAANYGVRIDRVLPLLK